MADRTLKILIDTGTANNYIKPEKELKNVMPVENSFTLSSIHGSSDVNTLNSFDAIIGFESLTRTGVALNMSNSIIKYANVTEKLKFLDCKYVNFTKIDHIVLPNSAKAEC